MLTRFEITYIFDNFERVQPVILATRKTFPCKNWQHHRLVSMVHQKNHNFFRKIIINFYNILMNSRNLSTLQSIWKSFLKFQRWIIWIFFDFNHSIEMNTYHCDFITMQNVHNISLTFEHTYTRTHTSHGYLRKPLQFAFVYD